MKKIIIIKSKKGMTLIEVVVSLAILSLLAIFIISVFSTSMSITGNNAAHKKNGKNAAAGIENKMAGFEHDEDISIVGEESGTLEVVFDSVTVNASGNFIQSTDKKGETRYYYFISD